MDDDFKTNHCYQLVIVGKSKGKGKVLILNICPSFEFIKTLIFKDF